MKNILTALLLLGVLINASAQSKRKIEANKKTSEIGYSMKHPLHEWSASAKDGKCIIVFNDDTQKVEVVAVVVAVRSFDSENSNRDSHALEVLEALKFPNITFSANNITDNGSSLQIKGNLVFHGVTKPVEVTAKKSISGKKLLVEGAFDINMTDYNVVPPGLMGLKTEELIKLNFKFNFDL